MSPRAACRLEQLGFTDVYDYVPGKAAWASAGLELEGYLPPEMRVGAHVRTDVDTCRADERLGDLVARFTTWPVCVVLAGDVVVGIIRREAAELGGEVSVGEVMQSGPVTARPSMRVSELAEKFTPEGHLTHVLVTTLEGRFLGIVGPDDLPKPT